MSGHSSVGINCRHDIRRSTAHGSKNSAGSCSRIIGLQVLSAEVYFYCCGFSCVKVNVAAQIVALQSDIVIIVIAEILEYTIFLIEGAGYEVTGTFSSSSYVQGIPHIIGVVS